MGWDGWMDKLMDRWMEGGREGGREGKRDEWGVVQAHWETCSY
jgi:hypothetical protein